MKRAQLVFLFFILIFLTCLIGLFKNYREIRAVFFGTDAQMMGLVQLYGLKPDWKKDCTEEQIRKIFEQATLEKPEIKVDCSFDLKKRKYGQYKNQTITKRLVLQGNGASHLRINCAGINIEPVYYKGNPSLKIQSEKKHSPKNLKKPLFFEKPENILIEDCKIRGSVHVGDLENVSSETGPQKILFDRLVIDSFLEEPCQKAVGHKKDSSKRDQSTLLSQ